MGRIHLTHTAYFHSQIKTCVFRWKKVDFYSPYRCSQSFSLSIRSQWGWVGGAVQFYSIFSVAMTEQDGIMTSVLVPEATADVHPDGKSPSPETIPLRSLTNKKCEGSGKKFSKFQLTIWRLIPSSSAGVFYCIKEFSFLNVLNLFSSIVDYILAQYFHRVK